MTQENTALIPLESVTAQDLFAGETDGKIIELVQNIEAEARKLAEGLDVNNKEDREEIASVAYKVARSKTTIDDAGRDLVAGMKAQVKVIDNRRKYARDTLDEVKAIIRGPLNDWKEAEKDRIQSHTDAITALRGMGNEAVELWQSCESIDELLTLREKIEGVDPSTFEEFTENAEETRLAALGKVNTAIAKREDYDRDQAELARLRKEDEERQAREAEERAEQERKEREEQIAREAKEQAAREAEEAAAERERELKAEAEAAEQRAREAEQKAQREREEREAAERREQEEKERRERNTRHRSKLNNEAKAAIVAASGVDEKIAKKIVTAIAKGEIDHVSIEY